MSKPTNAMILKRGVIVNTIGVVTRFSKALYVILFSSFLGAEKFGIYTYSFAIFDVLCTIVQFGYGQALAVQFGKYKHQNLDKYIYRTGNFVLGFAFIVASCMATLLYFLIPWAFKFFGHENEYVQAIQIFCIAIPAFALKYNILFSLRASFDTRPEAVIVSMIEPLLIFIGGLVVFHFKVDVYLACYAMVAAYYVSCGLAYWMFVKKYKRQINEKDPNFRLSLFLKSAYPIALMETMNMMMGRCDLLFIGYFVNTAMVGIYGAAYEITSMIMKVRAAIEPTLGNLVQKIHNEDNKSKTKDWLTSSMFWTLLPTTVIVGAIILSPNFFMSFFKFDDMYRSYFMVLSMLAVGRLLHAVFGLIDVPLYMVDHSHSSMKISMLNFFCNLVLFSILIPRIGIFGAGIGFVCSAVITCIYRLYLSKKIFGILPINWTFFIPVASFFTALVITKPLQLNITTNMVMTVCLILAYMGIYYLVFERLRGKFKPSVKTPA
jgi:O-antigen/teichoic acid export membrane protein